MGTVGGKCHRRCCSDKAADADDGSVEDGGSSIASDRKENEGDGRKVVRRSVIVHLNMTN